MRTSSHTYKDASAATEYSLWKATKRLKQPQASFPPLRRPDGDWTRNNMDKATTFAEHLSMAFTPHPDEKPQVGEARYTNTNTNVCDPVVLHDAITRKEVWAIIQDLNLKKHLVMIS